MSEPAERVAPYYCPYCASEDLRPVEAHGMWECRSCARAFAVKFVGLSIGKTSTAGRPVTAGVTE